MRLTPQPIVELFDPAWTAERLRAVGVCLTDADWTPLGGAAEPFFERYALPALRSGGPALGVTAVRTPVQQTRTQRQVVGLVAFSGSLPPPHPAQSRRTIAAWASALPAYSVGALQRLCEGLEPLVGTRHAQLARTSELESLSGQLADTYEELSLVYDISSSISVNSPTEQFLASACGPTAEVMEVLGLGVLAWDKRLGAHPPMSFGKSRLSAHELAQLDVVLRRLIDPTRDDAQVLINEVQNSPDLAWLYPRARQLLAVPMRRHGQTVGCMFAIDKDVPPEIFGTFNRGAFTSIDRKLLAGVAVHVALFLENRKLFLDSEALMLGLLHSLVAAVDAKDAYTCGHSVRVALFAKCLAETAGYEKAFCERVYLAGLLHDVGKIGVDDAVIRKPGKLTDEEFAQIKRHPEIGHRILEGIPQIHDVLPGVLHHHEKYNGRGYPHGLAGEQIPSLGRLMCIADSFDAMTSSRTYRTAMTPAAAMAEIRACAGTQFDPHLAALFCSIPETRILELIAAERDRQLPDYQLLQRAA